MLVDGKAWDVVHAKSVGEVSDAVKVSVRVREDSDDVSSSEQALRKLVDVAFDSSGVGMEEVGDHEDAEGAVHGDGTRRDPREIWIETVSRSIVDRPLLVLLHSHISQRCMLKRINHVHSMIDVERFSYTEIFPWGKAIGGTSSSY